MTRALCPRVASWIMGDNDEGVLQNVFSTLNELIGNIRNHVIFSEKLRDHEKPRIARLSAGNKAVEPREGITEDHVKLGIISALK